MTKRKAIPARVMVSVAIRQAFHSGFGSSVRCPLCSEPLTSSHARILEHMIPHATMTALGKDPDAIDNLRWVHAECASRKTNGTKATTAGSDKHMIAKGKRIAAGGKKSRNPMPKTGREIPSMSFQKRVKP